MTTKTATDLARRSVILEDTALRAAAAPTTSRCAVVTASGGCASA